MIPTNCPNCGAVITGHTCEYCGTVFNSEDVSNIVSKMEILRQQMFTEKLYRSAIEAMRKYSGGIS